MKHLFIDRAYSLPAICGLGLLLLTPATAASAQERDNPFVRPSTELEQRAARDQRIRDIIKEQTPAIQKVVMRSVARDDAKIQVEMRKHAEAVEQKISILKAAIGKLESGIEEAKVQEATQKEEKETAKAVQTNLLEGSTFVSCVNGSAIYADKGGNLFQVEAAENGGVACD
ncbi:hypothetical protein ACQU0X_26715 [Pseudovibrio ascidiaceicola]|uniref:hypothetical protein n=1 Tax=Pseudovibrio ascidiaceicola TaxID=285279 RepID=UPI003D3654D8